MKDLVTTGFPEDVKEAYNALNVNLAFSAAIAKGQVSNGTITFFQSLGASTAAVDMCLAEESLLPALEASLAESVKDTAMRFINSIVHRIDRFNDVFRSTQKMYARAYVKQLAPLNSAINVWNNKSFGILKSDKPYVHKEYITPQTAWLIMSGLLATVSVAILWGTGMGGAMVAAAKGDTGFVGSIIRGVSAIKWPFGKIVPQTADGKLLRITYDRAAKSETVGLFGKITEWTAESLTKLKTELSDIPKLLGKMADALQSAAKSIKDSFYNILLRPFGTTIYPNVRPDIAYYIKLVAFSAMLQLVGIATSLFSMGMEKLLGVVKGATHYSKYAKDVK